MPTHLALLRGINVGGRHRLPMAVLRDLATTAGHRQVATYIQSGNLVFTPDGSAETAVLAHELSAAIGVRRGFSPVVVVRTAAEWEAIVAADPYPEDADPRQVHLLTQQQVIGPAQRTELESLLAEHRESGGPDQLTVIGCTTYLHTPAGMGRSRLAARLTTARGAGGDQGTARNRRTARHLLRMLRDGAEGVS